MNKLLLVRDSYSDMGTFGKLYINGTFFCYTVEQEWKGNQKDISCIPEGTYQLKMRESPVVKKSTGGEFTAGWEITKVPNRTWVMLHPANKSDDVRGCIGCGDSLGVVGGRWAVLNSRNTFRVLMDKLDEMNDWVLKIDHIKVDYI